MQVQVPTPLDRKAPRLVPHGAAYLDDRIMREPEVYDATGLDRVTRWRMESKGKFPRRLNLGTNSIGWLASEINAWIAERAAARELA